MVIHVFIPYLLSVCAIITSEMATKLTEIVPWIRHWPWPRNFKVRWYIADVLKCMVRFAPNKNSVNKLDGLFHIWPWPLTLPVTLVMISQGHILKLPYLQNIWLDRKKKIKRGWIPWMLRYFVDHIWSTFCFRHMLQYRSGMTFLSFSTSIWSYHYRNGDDVYLGHNTC